MSLSAALAPMTVRRRLDVAASALVWSLPLALLGHALRRLIEGA